MSFAYYLLVEEHTGKLEITLSKSEQHKSLKIIAESNMHFNNDIPIWSPQSINLTARMF